ncbi:hypothetical protein ES319_D09G060100v1 [Gossypium barbadense]|uniref:Uncharacterized protein n=3 Tax=Gossypium TaxID=3633 RepID=A0A5J5Q170_GOSBA|nr:hypothetical protein ES319_D09G060100v1 [Gossypium barbadense]TYG52958.1 hypothetical protein ES288_D09G070200v1 [Gossypium darwinii]
MNSKQTPTRGFGQYSIASSFLSRPSHSSKEVQKDLRCKDSKKLTSLSDFLNQKLPRNSGIPKTVQEKSRPFSSLLSSNEGKPIDKQNERKKEEKIDGLNEVVFEQFKQDNSEKIDSVLSSSVVGEEENSRKRRNPFEGVDEQRRTRKPFLVLGEEGDDDPQNIKKRGRKECSTSNKKPKPHYNHYANGSGWWDCDMEGVDSEEVGYGEVWEGVGSTTFGGIVDWH